MDFFREDNRDILESIEYAQHIAFAPMVFQCTLVLKRLGLLEKIDKRGKDGIRFDEIKSGTELSEYGIRVLMEAGLGIGLFTFNEGIYKITKTGSYILHDTMTSVNMDFVNDVCYNGLFELESSIVKGKPEGLKCLGKWKTVYEGLKDLPKNVQKSWFAFDHFYSDVSFPKILPHVFKDKPPSLLDIGGNTGKWAIECLKYSENIHIGIVDLPGQLNMAKKNIAAKGFLERVSFYEVNLLEPDAILPGGFKIIWMSQFLDCFSEDEIVSILTRCFKALDSDGMLFILEPFWDKQKYKVSAFSLQMTSLYFTNIANGNSQMYHSELFKSLIEKSGFKIMERIDDIGVSHSLVKCMKSS